ncbi:hypothetical protein A0H76_2478 [Hepatospora eriocheir]|uniref:Uncharacterized protein n=1 Tax=Hepatospora eriocheir TaxID=1081669 RepID=A0A1X0QFD8_9MICR|nr:hypothetical protein A0H76_2478 [Hepatospora eriocheir]
MIKKHSLKKLKKIISGFINESFSLDILVKNDIFNDQVNIIGEYKIEVLYKFAEELINEFLTSFFALQSINKNAKDLIDELKRVEKLYLLKNINEIKNKCKLSSETGLDHFENFQIQINNKLLGGNIYLKENFETKIENLQNGKFNYTEYWIDQLKSDSEGRYVYSNDFEKYFEDINNSLYRFICSKQNLLTIVDNIFKFFEFKNNINHLLFQNQLDWFYNVKIKLEIILARIELIRVSVFSETEIFENFEKIYGMFGFIYLSVEYISLIEFESKYLENLNGLFNII